MGDDELARLGRRVWGAERSAAGRRRGGPGGAGERDEAIGRARRLLSNAREGVHRLVSPSAAASGVSLDAFDEDDWQCAEI